MPTPTLPARCRHLHADGRQCGSPALRAQPLCFQHRSAREPLPFKRVEGRFVPQLPAPDDFPAIGRGIAEVLRLLAEEEITEPRARTLLGGLALASQNLARQHRREEREARRRQAEGDPTEPVTAFTNHPELGPLAPGPAPEPIPADQQAQADRDTPIQQNQDLSPETEDNLEPEAPAIPATRFAPQSSSTPADEERVSDFYRELQESCQQKNARFLHQKTAELEAQFEARFEAKLQTRLNTELQSRLNNHLQTQPEPQPLLYNTAQPCMQPALA